MLNLKIARIKRNLTQTELAKMAGITQATYSTIERNGGGRLDTYLKIAKALDVPYQELLDTEE